MIIATPEQIRAAGEWCMTAADVGSPAVVQLATEGDALLATQGDSYATIAPDGTIVDNA